MDTLVVYFLVLSCATVFAQHADSPCDGIQLLNSEGKCVEPLVSRNIYVFAHPEKEVEPGTEATPIAPKLEYNIVFVKAPKHGGASDPIVVPPPQQKTIVYVLSKKGNGTERKVIEVDAGPKQKPEVYYVHYAEGENPDLPAGGVDLKTALEAVAQLAKTVSIPETPTYTTDPSTPVDPVTYAAPVDPVTYAAPVAPVAPVTVAPATPVAPVTYAAPVAPVAPVAPAVTVAPAAPVVPAVPIAPGTPIVYTTQAPIQPQPNYIYLSPHQQGGLGNYQPLGFPLSQ